MAETLYGDRQEAGARLDPPAPVALPPVPAGRVRARSTGFVTSARAAFEDRRLFVLLPFAAIAGLIAAASLPTEPQVALLVAVAVLLALVLVASLRSLAWTRVTVLLTAVWAGFCLLPIHGALLGTEMLVRPAYGTYQARVDEILSETQSEKRVILSAITPAADARALPVRRARVELADGKSRSFALDVWRETYAEPIETAADVSCDSVACVGESAAGFSYAIVADPAGFAEECGRDLIVSRIRAPGFCAAGVVIDADDLAAHGVHWLRWNAVSRSFEVRPAVGSLERPWRVRP